MSRFLVLGGSGYLGSRLIHLLPDSSGTFFGTSNHMNKNMYYFDGSDPYAFDTILKKIKPDIVINCIGFTKVDTCEQFPEKSWHLNASYPCYYAEICKKYDIKFVQISTDHYFNASSSKLQENDLCEPANQYGFSKLFAEHLILEVNPMALIVRTNFFHFNFRVPITFLDHLILRSRRKQKIVSFNDVIFTPISTNKLLECIYGLTRLNYCGLINICGSDAVSKFTFHEEVLKALGISTESHYPVSIEEVNLSATRPNYMALDNTLLESILNYRLPSIYDMIQEEIHFAKKEAGFVFN